jgi:hypothetical protein
LRTEDSRRIVAVAVLLEEVLPSSLMKGVNLGGPCLGLIVPANFSNEAGPMRMLSESPHENKHEPSWVK